MINGKDVYDILVEIVPMYFAFTIAYISVKWWKILSPEQASGFNRFLLIFVFPFLCVKVTTHHNLYAMNYKFFAADSLQKIVSLVILFLGKICSKRISLEWVITFFALSSLPNNIIMGIPIISAMYGGESHNLVVQSVVFQLVIWITVFLVLMEYRAATLLFSEKLRDNKVSNIDPPPKGFDDEVRKSTGDSSIPGPEEFTLNGIEINSMQSSYEQSSIDPNSNNEFEDKTSKTKQEFPGTAGGDSNHFGAIIVIPKDASFRSDTNSTANGEREMEMASTTRVMKKLIILIYMVLKNITRNPTICSSLLGVAWSLISFKYNIKMPTIIDGCISLLSNTGLALAMFNLGIFMAERPKIIACSKWEVGSALATRFIVSPLVMAAISKLVGLHGIALKTAIIQATFPQSPATFVFAKAYNVNVNVISSSAVVEMLIFLPVFLIYYIVLGLF